MKTQKINDLTEIYRKSLPEKATTVSAAWKKAETDTFQPEAMLELQSIFHKLAGSAGMYGYSELASQASTIEQSIILELEKPSSSNRLDQQWCTALGESVSTFVQSLQIQSKQGNAQ